ncbi:MAG: hypothetical protein QM765_33025 [Myxococcales bacterium]
MAANSPREPGPPIADAAWVGPRGQVMLGVYRSAMPALKGVYWLVGEADGPVQTSILQTPGSP